jgi:MerR family transcriptional regulator, light-induced transcriptional regulator
VGCAPGELHEIGPLMLALFLRRAGLRVAFVGQMTELESLVDTVKTQQPAVVLLSAALREHVEQLIAVGRRLAELPDPRPIFGFGGRAFAGDPELAARVPGLFLGADAQEAAHSVRERLSA